MLKKWFFPGILLVLFSCTSAQAQVSIIYQTQGKKYFSLEIPDNWRVNVGFEADPSQMVDNKKPMARVISVMPDDGSPLWFGMWVPPDVQNFKQAKEYMDSLDVELLTDVVFQERTFAVLNEMQVYYSIGTGKKNDELMKFYGGFIQISEENVAVAIYIGPHDATAAHKDELLSMFSSLQPGPPLDCGVEIMRTCRLFFLLITSAFLLLLAGCGSNSYHSGSAVYYGGSGAWEYDRYYRTRVDSHHHRHNVHRSSRPATRPGRAAGPRR